MAFRVLRRARHHRRVCRGGQAHPRQAFDHTS
jgi:hypothetical protein